MHYIGTKGKRKKCVKAVKNSDSFKTTQVSNIHSMQISSAKGGWQAWKLQDSSAHEMIILAAYSGVYISTHVLYLSFVYI